MRSGIRSVRVVAVATAVAALVAACSSGGGGGSSSSSGVVTLAPPSTVASGSATLPDQVEAGTAALAVGPRLVRFALTGCSLKPYIDDVGVAVVIDITGDDGQGGHIDISRKTTAGGSTAPTTTDTISYTAAGANPLIAQRFEVGGTVRDLRDPAASSQLLTRDDLTVRASGLFGALGAVAGAADVVHGDLLVTCTPDALTLPSSSSSG